MNWLSTNKNLQLTKGKMNFNYSVSNNGNYYLLVDKSHHRGRSFISQKHTLYCYDNIGNKNAEKKINFDNKHLANCKLSYLEAGEKLITTGFFMNKSKIKRGKSYFLNRINGI